MASSPEVIHAWSAPRSLSTSLMYSFSQRDDMDVLDEPLYANFLRVTGFDRPYREELLSKMDPDGNKVVKEVIFGPGEKKYRYCKHIAKQRLPNLTADLMKKGKHFILIRNPLNILPSFDKVVPPSFMELGVAELVAIYSELRELGCPPPVIDADDLQRDPEAVLSGLCEDLGIPFQPQMLKWKAGPRDFDGIWAPWWYESVHKSTGFSKSRHYPMTFPFALYDLLEQSLPFYNMLKRHVRKTAGHLQPPQSDPPLPVPENKKILVWVGDELLPRDSARISVFDSVVQGGDAVWGASILLVRPTGFIKQTWSTITHHTGFHLLVASIPCVSSHPTRSPMPRRNIVCLNCTAPEKDNDPHEEDAGILPIPSVPVIYPDKK